MVYYSWVIASPLSDVKPTISKQGSHFINEGFGFMRGRETLEAVVNIKTMLDRVYMVYDILYDLLYSLCLGNLCGIVVLLLQHHFDQ